MTDQNPTPQLTQDEQDEYFQKVARFLIDGGDLDAARLLLACDVEIRIDYSEYEVYDDDGEFFDIEHVVQGYIVVIGAQRKTYDQIVLLRNTTDLSEPNALAIHRAFSAFLLPISYSVKPSVDVDMSPGWRERLHDLVESGGVEVTNQGLDAEKSDYFKLWQGLKFRSLSEQRIAEALDRRVVLFLPNCAVRLGLKNQRRNKEADFLVIHNGKWGILEVDGPHHTGRVDADHDRDRLFKQHGITVVEHYNAEKCFNKPDEVVAQFLGILDRSGS